VNPSELLTAARDVLERKGGAIPALWPRTAAILGRHALEESIRGRWLEQPGSEGTAECSMRAQLASLILVMREEEAARHSFVWAALSSACHHHPYELAPTAAELGNWLDEVAQLIEL
jgi:hypothetical protein